MAGYKKGLKLGADGLWRFRIVVNGEVETGNTYETDYLVALTTLSIKRGELSKESVGIKPKKMITLAQAIDVWEADQKVEVTTRYIGILRKALETHFKPLLNRPLVLLVPAFWRQN